ncbi:enoyl-CoA hydratase/isomerase family protein [Pseudoduganella namucuonensis]|uniref:Enoyl-CoA hydratase n=1 Tax=Pseudoduganella namucuonensis TaxID=1035707 RepID=A0A1I7KZK3_9BURK|nr:enoyl-CoA hydratase-related protein [Pseudoduganella namucuonensis]SFV02734.1 Enoyl-CoA hydratase [Pseudoduganella namucuonensis]
MSQSTQAIVHRRAGAVAHIQFNRPQALNAIDSDMAAAFLRCCRDIAADDGVRAVLLSGAGRAFMAGGDVASFRSDPAGIEPSIIAPMHEALALLAGQSAPVLACVHGAVAGAGLSMALAADLVIAAEGTRFSFAYAALGASGDLGVSWSLPRAVGLRAALEIALLPEPLDAARARELGMVNRVVPADTLMVEGEALAERLAAGPTFAYGKIRGLMRASFGREFGPQLDAERDAFADCTRTDDFQGAVAAFLDKRKAEFAGR